MPIKIFYIFWKSFIFCLRNKDLLQEKRGGGIEGYDAQIMHQNRLMDENLSFYKFPYLISVSIQHNIFKTYIAHKTDF